jgi:hypothetical protein
MFIEWMDGLSMVGQDACEGLGSEASLFKLAKINQWSLRQESHMKKEVGLNGGREFPHLQRCMSAQYTRPIPKMCYEPWVGVCLGQGLE